MLNAIQFFPCVKRKTDWAIKWISNDSNFTARLLVSFGFASIFLIKKKNILPGSCLSNRYVSRGKLLHVAHTIMLYDKIAKQIINEDFSEIISEAVDIKFKFVTR